MLDVGICQPRSKCLLCLNLLIKLRYRAIYFPFAEANRDPTQR